VEGGPDRRAPAGSEWEREEGKEKGLTSGPELAVREKSEGGRSWAGGGVGTWAGGPAGLKGGKGERVWGFGIFFSFFSSNLFKLQIQTSFNFSNFRTFQTLFFKFSNYSKKNLELHTIK
jgi:hypothetical protein